MTRRHRSPAIRVSALVAVSGVAIAAVSIVSAADKREVPVMIGAHEDLDACGSWAEVSGLDPKGDGFLAVRSGPGTDYVLRARLREHDAFYVCGDSPDGKWVSIVHPGKGQEQADCGVSGAMRKPVAYRGPCLYGWVNVRWVNVLAG